MSSSKEQMINTSNDEEEFCAAMLLSSASILPMILIVAIELDLFEIMAKASTPPHQHLSASEIASRLPCKNPEAPAMLEQVLRFLASSSVLTTTTVVNTSSGEDGSAAAERLYGLAPVCKHFVRDENGGSVAPCLLLLQDKVVTECWYHLKDAIIEGGIPFNKAHGVNAFEYAGRDSRFNKVFNKAMHNHTSMAMHYVLEKYKGFAGLKEIVDVGGGFGATLGSIVSTYPNIIKGVEHVGGDMFESVPKGEVIFMKVSDGP